MQNGLTRQGSWWLFGVPVAVSVAAVVATGIVAGFQTAMVVAILAVLEVSLSFDNAVMNAGVLRRLSAGWQRAFLTLGLLIAVVGMRLLLPVLVVVVTAGLSFGSAVNLALHDPAAYGAHLETAHPVVAAFGGVFLLMIFLDFVIDESKRVHWLGVIERPLAKAGRFKNLSVLVALSALLVVVGTLAGDAAGRVLLAGLLGLAVYLVVHGFAEAFEHSPDPALPGRSHKPAVGWAALSLFIYLEVLDASFSFDGVVGAFAISNNVIVIALGLGIGALFMRALTVWLVRRGTLHEFIYLEHGAHYAVGTLAVLLAVSLAYEIPDAVTGLLGAAIIAWSVGSSLIARRRAH